MTELLKNEMMSSKEIAELTGKPHNDLMKSIRSMESSWEKIAQGKFSLGSYLDGNNQQRPMYLLDKRECLYIATKFNDEARAKLIIRWEELEKGSNLPNFNNPAEAARAWADEHEAKQLAEAKAEYVQKKLEISEDKRHTLQLLSDREWDKIDRDDLYRRKID